MISSSAYARDDGNKLTSRRQPSLPRHADVGVGAFRRDGASIKQMNKVAAASFLNQSTRSIFSYSTYDPSVSLGKTPAPVPIPRKINLGGIFVSPLGNNDSCSCSCSCTSLQSSPIALSNEFANVTRRLKFKFCLGPPSPSSPTAGAVVEGAGDDGNFEGNQTHTCIATKADTQRPLTPPPPPPRRAASTGSIKQRSELMNASSTDQVHTLQRSRSSDDSYDHAKANATEEEHGRIMPRMKLLEQIHQQYSTSSFGSILSSSSENEHCAGATNAKDLYVVEGADSGAGDDDGFKGNQTHTCIRTAADMQRPLPPPPPLPRRAASTGSIKHRSDLMNSSSTLNDTEHTLQRSRSSDDSYGHAKANATVEENVRIMPRMKLEQIHQQCSSSSFGSILSFASSSENEHYADTAEDFYARRMQRLMKEQSDRSIGAVVEDDGSVSSSSSDGSSDSLTSVPENENDDQRTDFNESTLTLSSITLSVYPPTMSFDGVSAYIQRPVKVSKFEDKAPPFVSSVPKNCDKHGRCKLHPEYKLYEKKLLGLGGYVLIGSCPICAVSPPSDPKLRDKNQATPGHSNCIPTSTKSQAAAFEQQHRLRHSGEKQRRSIGSNLRASRVKSFASALKHIVRAESSTHMHDAAKSRSEVHVMKNVLGLDKDVRALEKGDSGSSNRRTAKTVKFASLDDTTSQKNMKNRQTSGYLPRGSKKEADAKIGAKSSFSSRSGNSTTPNHHGTVLSDPSEGSRNRRVHRLLYTTPLGECGWYTGEVDKEGKPHGQGRMRFKIGHTYEGEWRHGYSDLHRENLKRMKSGFGSNKAAWKQSENAPSVRRASAPALFNTSGAVQSMQTPMYQHAPHLGHLPAQPELTLQRNQHAPHLGHLPAQAEQVQQQNQHAPHLGHLPVQTEQAQQQAAWMNMSPEERRRSMNEWYAIWLSDSGYGPKA